MTYYQYISVLREEIRKLNLLIDYKIIRGEGYSDEARRHREIMKKIRRHEHQRFMSKIYSFFHMIKYE